MNIDSNESLKSLFIYKNEKFGISKIVFGDGIEGNHYTIHFGDKSGIIDIHRTIENTDDHIPLVKIKKEDAIEILNKVSEYISSHFASFLPRKLELQTIDKEKYYLVSIYNHIKLGEHIKIKKNKIKILKSNNYEKLKNLIIPWEEILFNNEILISVYDKNLKLKGFIFKILNVTDSVDLFFISREKCMNIINELLKNILNIVKIMNIENKKNILEFLSEIIYYFDNL